MHSVAASIVSRPDQAHDYFRRAAAIDLEDSMSNSHHGIHAATQGGLLQAALIGFGGLHLSEDGPQTIARLPDHWDSLGFSFVHRGTRHEREVRGTSRPARQKPHGPTTTEEDKYETQDFRGPGAPDCSRRRLWRR